MPEKKFYKNYIFDLYGTLADIHTDEESNEFWNAFSAHLASLGVYYPADGLRHWYTSYVASLEWQAKQRLGEKAHPEIDLAPVFKDFLEKGGKKADDAEIAELAGKFRMLSMRKLHLFDGVDELFTKLRAAGKGIYLLSNAQSLFTRPELRSLGLLSRFDGVLLSSEAGVKKPDVDFYKALLEKYSLKAEDCIMVGNDDIADCHGSAAAGIDSLYVHTEQSPPPSGELPKCCKQISWIGEVADTIVSEKELDSLRKSGVLLPMTALPSNYGIGTMGKCAYDFVDFLAAAGQSYWQLLPLGPTGYGDSPYASFSTYAGNPYLIDLDMLVKDGLLTRAELKAIDWGDEADRVDYGKIYNNRSAVLRKAFNKGRKKLNAELEAFADENHWVRNYALFMALKAHFGGAGWMSWEDEDIRLRKPEAVERYEMLLKEDIDFNIFVQYSFFKQWEKLHDYAHEKGIEFIGDIPIYVALDSADLWSEPKYFQLDDRNIPTSVSGVPPDAFTADGQLWGNPLYDWEKMEEDGYAWWIRRIEGAKKLFDVIRIDHFRGLESYWAVKYGETTAKNGKWVTGPGMSFVSVLKRSFKDTKFIAEDLGYLTPEVKKLLQDSEFPGMKIIEFGLDAHGDSDYIPHRCVPNSVCYVGTHDNDTVAGWLKNAEKKNKLFAEKYFHITPDEGWCWGLIRAGMATPCKIFVAQMQDILELGADSRINTPGKATGNWQWRMLPGAINKKLAKKLLDYTVVYDRAPAVKAASEE